MPRNDNLALVKKFNIYITPKKKLSCLRSGIQVYDEVINFCQEMYSERDALLCMQNPIGRRKSHYFSSFLLRNYLVDIMSSIIMMMSRAGRKISTFPPINI
jgi:Ulp1 family protease